MSLEEPKQKKMKLKQEEEEERERHHDGGDDGDEEYELGAEEADKKDQSTLLMRNDAGEAYCELSNKRRLTVRKYKGTVFVDLREFYEKDGKAMPGKKGISLTAEQYLALSELVKEGSIDQEIDRLSNN